jgi:hypothetical protein
MSDWGGKYHRFQDTLSWTNKKQKIVFVGTTTGSREPKQNKRINTCLWALDNGRDRFCDFWITNIAQIDAKKIFAEVPKFRYIFRPPMPLSEQMTYKYMLSIDGNTCRWNPDACFMNTLSLCLPSKDMLWYSPLFMDKQHHVNVDTTEGSNNLLKVFSYYENNHNEAVRIIQNANELGKSLFTPQICQSYTVQLFEGIAENSR